MEVKNALVSHKSNSRETLQEKWRLRRGRDGSYSIKPVPHADWFSCASDGKLLFTYYDDRYVSDKRSRAKDITKFKAGESARNRENNSAVFLVRLLVIF
jgi:hypothetical protein